MKNNKIKLKMTSQPCLKTLAKDLNDKIGGHPAHISEQSNSYLASSSNTEYIITLFKCNELITQRRGVNLDEVIALALADYQKHTKLDHESK
jgi:hypothetical protein